jgi:hypothetical protein
MLPSCFVSAAVAAAVAVVVTVAVAVAKQTNREVGCLNIWL